MTTGTGRAYIATSLNTLKAAQKQQKSKLSSTTRSGRAVLSRRASMLQGGFPVVPWPGRPEQGSMGSTSPNNSSSCPLGSRDRSNQVAPCPDLPWAKIFNSGYQGSWCRPGVGGEGHLCPHKSGCRAPHRGPPAPSVRGARGEHSHTTSNTKENERELYSFILYTNGGLWQELSGM